MRTLRRAAIASVLAGAALAVPVAAAAVPPGYEPLSDEWKKTLWSYVYEPGIVRARPSSRSRRVGRLKGFTWSGSVESVLVLGRHDAWSRIRFPRLGRDVGWVRSRTLSAPAVTRTAIVVNRRRTRLTAYRAGRRVLRVRVGVGTRLSPTPAGRSYVRERVRPDDRTGIYGVLAFGLSAYSAHRTDWPGGGQVGIHGTNQPRLLPGRVSNGCVRLRNRDVRRLDRIVAVGTPVRIR